MSKRKIRSNGTVIIHVSILATVINAIEILSAGDEDREYYMGIIDRINLQLDKQEELDI